MEGGLFLFVVGARKAMVERAFVRALLTIVSAKERGKTGEIIVVVCSHLSFYTAYG